MASSGLAFDGRADISERQFVDELLKAAVERVNQGTSRTLMARLASERPPQDARHLTDTRTRVSTLLEFAVAYEMNDLLAHDGHALAVSAVLWNVFPDLLVRDSGGAPVLGLEVKALHTAAEEKSANLSTPLAIIRKGQDFLVILAWGWSQAEVQGVPFVYPHVHKAAAFDAWLLARIRDYGWLASRKDRQEKAIDLSSPVISGPTGDFKAEEGNMGKLLRISLPDDAPSTLTGITEMRAEHEMFRTFTRGVLALGLRETFLDVCALPGVEASIPSVLADYPSTCQVIGHATSAGPESTALVAGDRPERWLATSPSMMAGHTRCLWLGRKLAWKVFIRGADGWDRVADGKKPDSDLQAIQKALRLA